MYEKEIAELQELITRYRTNALAPNIAGTPIAEGQLQQAVVFEGQLEALLTKKEINENTDNVNVIPEIKPQTNYLPLVIVGGIIAVLALK